MKRFEVSEADVAEFTRINAQLAEGKKAQSEGEKKVKASKAFVAKWLKDNRSIDVEDLSVGEIVIIQIPTAGGMKDCFEVKRKARSGIDVTRLQNEKPDIAKEFTTSG